jgi:hypothetical protein
MALKPCRECKKEVSTEASSCPHCGKKAPTASPVAKVIMGLLLVAALFVIIPFFAPGGGLMRSSMGAIEKQVTNDVVAQYNTARQGGNAIDVCVHAGLVKAAYIQAKDAAGTSQWNKIERADCGKAGLPRF